MHVPSGAGGGRWGVGLGRRGRGERAGNRGPEVTSYLPTLPMHQSRDAGCEHRGEEERGGERGEGRGGERGREGGGERGEGWAVGRGPWAVGRGPWAVGREP